MILPAGQCSTSYDLESRFRGRRSTLDICFQNVNRLRRSCVSSARNAGKVAFFDFLVHLAQDVLQDPDTSASQGWILTQRSCRRDLTGS